MSKKPRAWQERFWEKVDRSSPDGCWLWTAATFRDGYGLFKRATSQKVGPERAHRLSFEMANGRPAKVGMVVCHRCDVPACVNPAHLYEGTVQDNVRDSMARGRWAFNRPPVFHGSKHPNARLSMRQIAVILNMHSRGHTQRLIAEKFGVSQQLISLVVSGKRR